MASFQLIFLFLLQLSRCSVVPVWKTPITERRFAPPLKRSSAPYYTRPEDFKVPNYQLPQNNPIASPRLPITPPGFRPNYNIYPRPFQPQPQFPPRNFYQSRPAYPQAYQPQAPFGKYQNGWIYWNGALVPPEILPYLQGPGPIPPQGAYGPPPTTQPAMSPGVRPETFTGTIPMSPSASPTIPYNTYPPTVSTEASTTPTIDFGYSTPSVTPEEATMGHLFTAKKNPFTSETTYDIPETTTTTQETTVPYEVASQSSESPTTTEETTTAEYFPRPVPAQAYQPSKGPEIVEKLNVNILHPNGPCSGPLCFDKNKVSVYTPPKGPKLLISNAAKGQANLPRSSVPEHKYLPYAPNFGTSARPIEPPSGGPRVFLPPNDFSLPPYEEPTPPPSPQVPYLPTARTLPPEYASPPSAPPPSPPSYTPTEEDFTPTVPDYNRQPASTFAPFSIPPNLYTEAPTTTPRLPPWATETPPEETFSPTYRPLPSTTPEVPTPPSERVPGVPRLPPGSTIPPQGPGNPSTPTVPPTRPQETPIFPTSPPSGPTPPQFPSGSTIPPQLPGETPGFPTRPTIPQFPSWPTVPPKFPGETPVFPTGSTPSPTFPQQTPEVPTGRTVPPLFPTGPTGPLSFPITPSTFSEETPGIPTGPIAPPPGATVPPELSSFPTVPPRFPETPSFSSKPPETTIPSRIPPLGGFPSTENPLPTVPQGIPTTSPPTVSRGTPSTPPKAEETTSVAPRTSTAPRRTSTPYFTQETITTPSPYSTTPKKGVQNRLRAGKVRVVCREDGIKFIATSILPFTGEIFANDRKRIPACFHTFQNAIMPMAFLPFTECGVKNSVEQQNNQTQYHMQVIVVVKQSDGSTTVQSYMAQCVHQKIQYNKQTLPRRIEEALEELRLVPTKLEQKALLPLVEMKLLVDEHGRIGPEVAAVDIGMPLALHWKLTNESAAYGFHVKNCAVADSISGMDMMVVDEQGCSTDTTILGHPHYDTYHDTASSHMWAFKVPDHSKLRFSCEVSICTDISPNGSNETSCSSIPTPPFCPDLITSPSNSILFDGGSNFLKRRREIENVEATQIVRAAICTSEDCRRDYVALPHCVNHHWLAATSAFSVSLFLLSILVNLALRWKVSHQKIILQSGKY